MGKDGEGAFDCLIAEIDPEVFPERLVPDLKRLLDANDKAAVKVTQARFLQHLESEHGIKLSRERFAAWLQRRLGRRWSK